MPDLGGGAGERLRAGASRRAGIERTTPDTSRGPPNDRSVRFRLTEPYIHEIEVPETVHVLPASAPGWRRVRARGPGPTECGVAAHARRRTEPIGVGLLR